jgi:glutathionylspermidine synthase
MDKKVNYSVRWTQAYGPIQSSGWRKRQIINKAIDELHNMQLDMIDEVVSRSDLKEANELINFIKSEK